MVGRRCNGVFTGSGVFAGSGSAGGKGLGIGMRIGSPGVIGRKVGVLLGTGGCRGDLLLSSSLPGDNCVDVDSAFPSTDKPSDWAIWIGSGCGSDGKGGISFLRVLAALIIASSRDPVGGRGAGRDAMSVEVLCAIKFLRSCSFFAAVARSMVGILFSAFCISGESFTIGCEMESFPTVMLLAGPFLLLSNTFLFGLVI